ncbi:MAG: ATP-binding protein [Nitrososphaerota archaeon]|nr:ATP-binding protein [Nitrososphaerota archaeon]
MQPFDDLDGEFKARLREIATTTRSTVDDSTVTFRTARIDCEYTPNVIKRLAMGQLVAIPNVQALGANSAYSLYEIADVYPMHYSMLTLDRSQPAAIRTEFMDLIQKEWEKGSKSTWIEIVAVPIGYVMKAAADGVSYERRAMAPLTGSQVKLLSKEAIEELICFKPQGRDAGDYSLGKLLGFTDGSIAFSVNLEQLIHYMSGTFAFTGSGKSNLTATVIRKALHAIPDLKVVIFDVSAEYGIHILDVLNRLPSRVLFTDSFKDSKSPEAEYFKRHATPEALAGREKDFCSKIAQLFAAGKVEFLQTRMAGEEDAARFSTYEGIVEVLSNTLNEKYGPVQQKILVPQVIELIKEFLRENKLDIDARFNAKTMDLIHKIQPLLADLPTNSALKKAFDSLARVVESIPEIEEEEEGYSWSRLSEEILSTDKDSPRVFVINLPEAEDARLETANVINEVFRKRKRSFTLSPRVLFVIDEAQEFIPQNARKEDGTDQSSRALERLLRHGRKYHLNCWVGTQRVAHLNTNALQQLHTYFVSTMPRPYDRQLISDTFAIDDAFMERTLAFQNGDWLLTSFKATATQNIPVFFHAENNEEILDKYLK